MQPEVEFFSGSIILVLIVDVGYLIFYYIDFGTY